ncbi:MAG: HAMP domain-containing histidine kinase [Erysipelotrichaceae bacterium]|nr:HAMP domain-containing histidine kinase [Erysipelotrichaceae bacterium]
MIKSNLTEQLFIVFMIVLGIMIISLGLILPNMLIPIYETNVYNYLRQPLSFLQNEEDIKGNTINTEVAYLYISTNGTVSISDNFDEIIDTDIINSLDSTLDLNQENGKFKYKRNTYYYVTSISNGKIRIAITSDGYVSSMRRSILVIIFEVVGITFVIVSFFILVWSNNLVNRIKKIKDKIDNMNNEDYSHVADTRYCDELYTLDRAVQDMHLYLMEQEEYKNQMYQNISHDFKTPITVMKSYIEACEDGIQTKDETLKVIKEQLKKLEIKVHSLLYLNKLNYLREQRDRLNEQYDISLIIYAAVDKFKMSRPDVEFVLDIDKKSTVFRGSADMWEAIIDNILNNFLRYAKKKIKITVKNNKITLYNDGETIDENVLNNIFTPYEKGVKGVFGLGLSIVQKTLHFLHYEIKIENVKNGVKFTIYE